MSSENGSAVISFYTNTFQLFSVNICVNVYSLMNAWGEPIIKQTCSEDHSVSITQHNSLYCKYGKLLQ